MGDGVVVFFLRIKRVHCKCLELVRTAFSLWFCCIWEHGFLLLQYFVCVFENTSPVESERQVQWWNDVFLKHAALLLAHQPHFVCFCIPNLAVSSKLGTDFHWTFPVFRVVFIKSNIEHLLSTHCLPTTVQKRRLVETIWWLPLGMWALARELCFPGVMRTIFLKHGLFADVRSVCYSAPEPFFIQQC